MNVNKDCLSEREVLCGKDVEESDNQYGGDDKEGSLPSLGDELGWFMLMMPWMMVPMSKPSTGMTVCQYSVESHPVSRQRELFSMGAEVFLPDT